MFDEELRTLAAHRVELLARALGKYVVIKGREIVGCFDSAEEARREGYRNFGHVPFLVRLITDEPSEVVK